ncbi:hypothetical protein ACFJIX_22285 [Roseateles sp. UC29_93]|uniref:hypothetical protein n=1 Tax=Roseateles sp. UC29_93 TaxID=3350177 RepID=UPI00366BB2EF
MYWQSGEIQFDVEVVYYDDSDEELDRDRPSPAASAPLCPKTRDAIDLVDERSALPADGIAGKALCKAFLLPAVALDLRDPPTHNDVYSSTLVPAAMASPGGAMPTFELVRRRIDDWGCRLLQVLNADDPGSECNGSLAARTASAEALYSEFLESPMLLERALPMLFRASMIDSDVDHHSAGGRRVLHLCGALPKEKRTVLIGLLNGYEGVDTMGRPIHRDIEHRQDTSWLTLNAKRMPDLTREMFEALGLEQLRQATGISYVKPPSASP